MGMQPCNDNFPDENAFLLAKARDVLLQHFPSTYHIPNAIDKAQLPFAASIMALRPPLEQTA